MSEEFAGWLQHSLEIYIGPLPWYGQILEYCSKRLENPISIVLSNFIVPKYILCSGIILEILWKYSGNITSTLWKEFSFSSDCSGKRTVHVAVPQTPRSSIQKPKRTATYQPTKKWAQHSMVFFLNSYSLCFSLISLNNRKTKGNLYNKRLCKLHDTTYQSSTSTDASGSFY